MSTHSLTRGLGEFGTNRPLDFVDRGFRRADLLVGLGSAS
jgi:hypothetical protein